MAFELSPRVKDLIPVHTMTARPLFDGVLVIFDFPNGYGASVIQHSASYGVELAVVGLDGTLDYSTPITNDVIGYIPNTEALAAILTEIAAL